jgi:ribosomal protein L32
MGTMTEKVCSVCNVDCSTKPRVKDELGRYTCKACFDGVAAKAAHSAAAAQQNEDADLRAAAMMEAKSMAADLPEAQSCPRCQNYLTVDQRVCLRCGYDRKRGAKVMTKVEVDKEVKSDWVSKRRQSQKVDKTVGLVVWSLCLVLLAGFSVGFYVPVLFMITVPILALISVCTTVTLIVFAFIDTDRSAAVCGLSYIPIYIFSTLMARTLGLLALFGLLASFLCWARLMYYGATQGRSWLAALSNTVVAQILIVILAAVLLFAGVLPVPDWVRDAFDNAQQQQQRQNVYDQP